MTQRQKKHQMLKVEKKQKRRAIWWAISFGMTALCLYAGVVWWVTILWAMSMILDLVLMAQNELILSILKKF